MKTKEEILDYIEDIDLSLMLLEDTMKGQIGDAMTKARGQLEDIRKYHASQFQQEWIPVEVRLPEITMQTSSNWVLTFDKSITRIDKAFYSTVTGWQAEHGEPMNVSHWMPLPTPPLPQPYNPTKS